MLKQMSNWERNRTGTEAWGCFPNRGDNLLVESQTSSVKFLVELNNLNPSFPSEMVLIHEVLEELLSTRVCQQVLWFA